MAALLLSSAHHPLHSAEQHSHGHHSAAQRGLVTCSSHAQQCRRASGPPAALSSAAAFANNNCSHHHHELGASPPQHHQPLERCNSSSSSSAAAAASQAPSLGWNAGFAASFRLGEVVGRGSFATVHRAVHCATGATYAVKVLPKRRCPQQLESIRREAGVWATAAAACRYVARLEGLFEDEDQAYMVQELCGGGSLKDLLSARGGALSEGESIAVMAGVLDLLSECHKRDICYGDLKPANVLFNSSDSTQPLHVRAIDFGCSQQVHAQPLSKACGSPVYMAAEVVLQRYGVGVDVWSAGVMVRVCGLMLAVVRCSACSALAAVSSRML
jgi:serine/threonine protein kinase